MATDDPTTSSKYGNTRSLLTLLATQFFLSLFFLLTFDSGGYIVPTSEVDARQCPHATVSRLQAGLTQ